MEIKSYKDLAVWQKSDDLAFKIYGVTRAFPKSEVYGLSAQMRRAAISIPLNIAEGFSRKTKKDLSNFLGIALGSLNELDYQVRFSAKLSYIQPIKATEIEAEIEIIGKMLNKLSDAIQSSDHV